MSLYDPTNEELAIRAAACSWLAERMLLNQGTEEQIEILACELMMFVDRFVKENQRN